jgi:hypothetical protein
MKMKHLAQVAILLFLCCTMFGCQDEWTADSPIHFTVYGTVFDRYTGDPVSGAQVTLYYGTHVAGVGTSNPNGAAGSGVSGSDGQYRIPCIATDNLISVNRHMYQIEASCYGYHGYSEKVTIMETEGVEIQMDILLN